MESSATNEDVSVTYVSAFYNIGRVSSHPMLSFESYFARIEQLFALPIKLVFFTTSDILARLEGRYTPRADLIIHVEEVHPYAGYVGEIQNIWGSYQTNLPSKDTAEFAALTFAKFMWVKAAIDTNLHKTTHFAWIDAGLFKIATEADLIPSLIPHDKVRIMIMNYTTLSEVEDPNFVLTCRYRTAGGFFTGRADFMLRLCRFMITTSLSYLAQGQFGLEQEFMIICYVKHPDLFDPYYGDFHNLINGYYHPTDATPHWLIPRVRSEALRHNDQLELSRIDRYLSST
jgi:hypothetical protein